MNIGMHDAERDYFKNRTETWTEYCRRKGLDKDD